MRNIARRLVTIGVMSLFLAACTAVTGTEEHQGPVGIGKGINEMKRSPCACTEIPMLLPKDIG